MTEEREDILVLVDEEGNEEEFEYLDTIEMEGDEYVVLLPCIQDEYEDEDEDENENENENEEEEQEVVILKIVHDSEDKDSFINTEDEDELNSVFEEFKLRMEEEFDFQE